MVGRGETNSLDFIDFSDTASNGTHGLYFDIELSCDVNQVLCKDNMDYISNPIAGAMALAVQYQSAINVMKSILAAQR